MTLRELCAADADAAMVCAAADESACSYAYDHRAVMQQTSKAAALHVKPASIQYGTHSYHVLITSVVYSQTQEQPM
eukprot:3066-Heterococcus_DN1.PRE.2